MSDQSTLPLSPQQAKPLPGALMPHNLVGNQLAALWEENARLKQALWHVLSSSDLDSAMTIVREALGEAR